MAPGREVAFLRQRTGFVRLAMQQGAPLVPAFAFGQTEMFRWRKPPLPSAWVGALSRAIGGGGAARRGTRWTIELALPRTSHAQL
jgi:2-acylglycerol O-acyltransferase 2